MAYGSGTGSNDKFLTFKPRDKDKDKNKISPRFLVSEKVDGKWVEVETKKPVTNVKGDLTKVEVVDNEPKDPKIPPYKSVRLFLRDAKAEELYLVDCRFNIATRNLFNSLIALETFNDVEISIYENKKGYTSFGVRQNGENVTWKFKLDELPKVEVLKDKKGAIKGYDSDDLDAKFEEELLALAARVKDHPVVNDVPEDAEEVDSAEDIEF